MQKELSIIIPTLQKNPLFHLLLANLNDDPCVSKIIIINNSQTTLNFSSSKLQVIDVEKNIFVNPAWNLGIKHCGTDYWCLMNDDIMLCENFCSKVLDLLTPHMGVVGIMGDFVKCVDTHSFNNIIKCSNEMYLRKMYHLCYWFGIAMFGHKDAYINIPEELKVFFGDNYLLYTNRENGKQNYAICGQELYHLGSLSSKEVSHMGQEEKLLYEKCCKKYSAKLKLKQSLARFK